MTLKQLETEIMDHLKEAPVVREHLKALDWKINWVMVLISGTFLTTLAAFWTILMRR